MAKNRKNQKSSLGGQNRLKSRAEQALILGKSIFFLFLIEFIPNVHLVFSKNVIFMIFNDFDILPIFGPKIGHVQGCTKVEKIEKSQKSLKTLLNHLRRPPVTLRNGFGAPWNQNQRGHFSRFWLFQGE